MKKYLLLLAFGIILFAGFSFASAASCDLDVQMISQDPYPAVPGDYVKLVFQVEGVENPECGEVYFELIPDYPISFDPGVKSSVQIRAGTYTQDFPSYLQVPFKVRVSEDAVDGDNPIEVRFIGGNLQAEGSRLQEFNISVENVKADFEVSVSDYDASTNTITFDILNVGEADVEALTVDVPHQDNFQVRGPNRNIIGSLDSQEDTSFTFEGTPKEGEIKMSILYTDQINVRRTVEKTVYFDPKYFPNDSSGSKSVYFYLFVILLLAVIGFFVWKKFKSRKSRRK